MKQRGLNQVLEREAKVKKIYKQFLTTISVLCVLYMDGSAIPTGPMADYYLDCGWGLTYSEAACASLVDRLEALEWKSREEKLALLKSKAVLYGIRGDRMSEQEICDERRAIEEEHPEYPQALVDLALCTRRQAEITVLLLTALEIEPDNFYALSPLLLLVHGSAGDQNEYRGISEEQLAVYRESYYEAAKLRMTWRESVAPTDSGSTGLIRQDLLIAARYLYYAAVRAGDEDAVEALHARLVKDAGLVGLDFRAPGTCTDEWEYCQRGSAEDNLKLACHGILNSIKLEDICVSAVEELVQEASHEELAVPDHVLLQVESTVRTLRDLACPTIAFQGDECRGPVATETDSIARLRAIFKNHGGTWSSEHHRVFAQSFLGDSERLDGLRTALRLDPTNAQARCDLALALTAREKTDEAREVIGDGDPSCLQNGWRGFTWVDHKDFLEAQERERDRLLRRKGQNPPTQ